MSVGLLNIGTRSLGAAQAALSTIGHNIANVNTTGFSRQEAVLSTANGQFTGAGFFGNGVDVTTVRRQYDQFLTAAVQSNEARAAADSARANQINQLDRLFASPELGVGAAMDSAFSALGDVANRPADSAARQTFLARVSQLAGTVNTVADRLSELDRRNEEQIRTTVSQVNSKLSDVALLNKQIAESTGTGHSANDLLDRRDTAIVELNRLIRVNTVAADDGTLSVFANGGEALVLGGTVARLNATPSAEDATHLQLNLTIGSGSVNLAAGALGGGALAGLLRFRDEDLASATNEIGRIATVLADGFNTMQASGIDTSGVAGSPMFSIAPPKVLSNAQNSGTQGLQVTVSNAALLKASDYKVTYDGSNYTVTRIADGQVTTPLTFPITVDGLDFTPGATGTMSAGDSFLVRPLSEAGASLRMQLLAPSQIATGLAATVQVGAANQGDVNVLDFSVTNNSATTAQAVTLSFTSPTAYTLTDTGTGTSLGTGTYTPGSPISLNGWNLTLNGPALTGDTFAIGPTASPQVDNRNALKMLELASTRSVDGGTLNEAYAGLIGDVGVRVQSARQASSLSGQVLSDAVSRQQQVSGVNLDEEAANLLRYQQAYQASAQLIQTAQSLFDTLIATVRR